MSLYGLDTYDGLLSLGAALPLKWHNFVTQQRTRWLCKLSLNYKLEIFLSGFGNFAVSLFFHDLRTSMAKYLLNYIGHII